MRIAIAGAGGVGTTLGRGWVRVGHNVIYGVRDLLRARDRGLAEGAAVRTVAEAALAGEVVVLATPWETTQAAVTACGDLGGRILVDCTNPLLGSAADLDIGFNTSGGEQVAAWARGARVVKAFNTVGVEVMANPVYEGLHAALPVCGNDDKARRTVMQLAGELGFEAIDAGPLRAARWTEPLAMLCIHLAIQQRMGRELAFGLLNRTTSR